MVEGWRGRLLYKGDRVRPGLRILLFFLLFFLFGGAAQYVVSVLPRHPLEWGGLAGMTLAALLAGWLVLARVDDRPFGALGFAITSRTIPHIVAGFAIGGGLILLTVLLLFVSGSASFTSDSGTVPAYVGFLGWTFLYLAVAAAFEEIVFRGYPFQVLVEWIGVWPAVVLSSVVFAALHAQNPSVTALALVNIFAAGVLLCLAFLKTRSLWFATALHLGWNWTMASVLDFPVSGLGFETPLYTGVPTGPQWWTGGPFGPEAGVAGTLIIAGAIVWLLRTERVKADPGLTSLRPIVEDRLATGTLA